MWLTNEIWLYILIVLRSHTPFAVYFAITNKIETSVCLCVYVCVLVYVCVCVCVCMCMCVCVSVQISYYYISCWQITAV